MKMTSAEANKLLRKLHDDHSALERMETESRTFVAATTEKLEDARPEYDYTAVQEKLAELEDKARRVKHAINLFNISQTIDDSGMTIDQALVYTYDSAVAPVHKSGQAFCAETKLVFQGQHGGRLAVPHCVVIQLPCPVVHFFPVHFFDRLICGSGYQFPDLYLLCHSCTAFQARYKISSA